MNLTIEDLSVDRELTEKVCTFEEIENGFIVYFTGDDKYSGERFDTRVFAPFLEVAQAYVQRFITQNIIFDEQES